MKKKKILKRYTNFHDEFYTNDRENRFDWIVIPFVVFMVVFCTLVFIRFVILTA